MLGLGISLATLSLAAGLRGGGYKFTNPEAQALVARFATQPTSARKQRIDTFWSAAKAGGWSAHFALWAPAASNEQAAQINWMGDLYNLTPVNNPDFTANVGFAGDGLSTYLTTGILLNALANFQDNASIWAWCSEEVTNAYILGTIAGGVTRIQPRSAGQAGGRLNGTGAVSTQASSLGLTVVTRNGTTVKVFRNDVLIATATVSSSALGADEICLLRDGSNYFNGYAPMAGVSPYMADALIPSLYNAVKAYLTGLASDDPVVAAPEYVYASGDGPKLILLGDSWSQQEKVTTSSANLHALARGELYYLMGWYKNFRHANYNDSTNYWGADVPDAVAKAGMTRGANYAIGGSGLSGYSIDLLDIDGVAPLEVARPFAGGVSQDFAYIHTGTNPINAGESAASIISRLQTVGAYLIAQGCTPCIETVGVRALSSWAIDDPKRQVWGEVNASIMDGTWCGPGQAIECVDINTHIASATPDSFGYYSIPSTNALGPDGIHPGPKGAYYIAKAKRAVHERLTSTGSIWPLTPADPRNYLEAAGYNPSFAKNGTGGVVAGSGVSGLVVNQHAVLRGGSLPIGSSAGTTYTLSRVLIPGTSFYKQRIAIVPGGTEDTETVVLEKYSAGSARHPLPTGIAAGDRVRMLMDISLSAWDGWRGFPVELAFYDASNVKIYSGRAMGHQSLTADRYPTEAMDLTAVTELLQVPVGATQFSWIATLATACIATGTATADYSNPRLVKETYDPTVLWPAG